MDKNLPKDPLEEFFKKSLEGQNELPADDGWDVPSSNVWDRVEADIQPVAIVRPINYWKWTAAVASVVVLFFVYQWTTQNQQIKELTTELHENTEKLEDVKELLQRQQEELESTIVEQSTTTIDNHQSTANEEIVQQDHGEESQRSTSFSGKNKDRTGGENNIIPPSTSTQNNGNLGTQNSVNSPLVKINNSESLKEKVIAENESSPNSNEISSDNSKEGLIENKTVLEINELPNRIFGVESIAENKVLKADLGKTVIFDSPKEKVDSRFYLGVYGSRNLGQRSIIADDSNLSQIRINKIKNIQEKESWTTGGGLKLGFQINKRWSVESGLQYTKSEITARHRIQKQYNVASEIQNSSGDFENDFALLLVTPMGDVESDITLTRSSTSNAIPDQLLFNIPVESKQRISFLGIPILAKYRFGNESFRVGVKGGILTNFILDADVEISAVDAPFPNLRYRRNRINNKTELRNLKSTTINWLVGIEAEARINDVMYFSFEPSFSKSLSPIFEKNSVKTYPLMVNVKVGVNYLF